MKEKENTSEQFFNTFNRWNEHKEKTKISFVGIIILNNSQILRTFTKTSLNTPTKVLFCEISKFFLSSYSNGTPPVAASGIDKSFLILIIMSFVWKLKIIVEKHE